MPEGRRRRCPNVINIFRARGVEKDCLPSSFLHPPRLVLFSPGPNFLADAPSAEGAAADFQSAFLFHLFPFASSLCITIVLPPLLRKGPRLNSQRPHREKSVNAKERRKGRERRTSEDCALRLFESFSSRRNSNFVAFTWANLRAEARQTEWDLGIIHFDDGDVNFYQLAVIYSERKVSA